MFDIVIPLGPYDLNLIQSQIEYTKKNIIGYRNLYIISRDNRLNINECFMIDEKIFPFSIETVLNIHGKSNRHGWYLQQLLKLYAGLVIPNILDTYLVIDADTFFLKPNTFIEDGKCLYNYGFEHHPSYFNHMKRMNNNLTKQIDKSGICHHMMFETKYINELFESIEKIHKDVFYNVFLKCVLPNDYELSGASEYEIYFNYMLYNHPDKIKIRSLKWKNDRNLILNEEYDYISIHYWL